MKTLAFCMTFIRDGSDAKLLKVWEQLMWSLNPECDLLIVDSASPLPVTRFLKYKYWLHELLGDDEIPKMHAKWMIARFQNSLGHPIHEKVTQGAGSDRAMMKGFEIAIANDYDKVAYIELDLMCIKPVKWALDIMIKPAACAPITYEGKHPETGYWIADCKHMAEIDFVARYNWKGPCWPEGEKRQWDIYGEALQFLPLKGDRDQWHSSPETFRKKWAKGVDFVTHAKPEVFAEFLRMNGYDDLARIME